jgi:L-fucose mutarotase/ribose pyranase (RbsD/FucU family)
VNDNVTYAMLAKLQLNELDKMAEAWADEVKLSDMIKNAASPMSLNSNVPSDVRQQFRARMEKQMDAIARQAFVEGAHRAVCMVQDAYRQAGFVPSDQK